MVTPGFVRVIKNEGMPKSKQPGQKGDMRIVFDVQVRCWTAVHLPALLPDIFASDVHLSALMSLGWRPLLMTMHELTFSSPGGWRDVDRTCT